MYAQKVILCTYTFLYINMSQLLKTSKTTKTDISIEVHEYLKQVSARTGIPIRRIIDDGVLPYAQKLEQLFAEGVKV
jgi:hypothetical protein